MENHKKILLLVISLIIGFMVVGCSDNDSPEIPQVPINFTINVTDVTSNSAKVTVTPSNTDI